MTFFHSPCFSLRILYLLSNFSLFILPISTTSLHPRAPSTSTPSLHPLSTPVLIHTKAVYPRATTLFNFSSPHPDKPLILSSYTVLSAGNKTLSASISPDNAQTWQFLANIWTANATTHDIDNPFPLQLPNGHILYAFRNHDIDPLTGQYLYYRITVCLSTDHGHTWEFLSHAHERPADAKENNNNNNGLWEPFMRLDRRGKVQIYYSSERGAKRQDNIMRISNDSGKTWTAEEMVVVSRGGNGQESRDGMMGVAEVGGGGEDEEGHLICIFETTEDGGKFGVDMVESFDDGGSWGVGTRRRVYTAAKGRDAGAPQVVGLGGWLVGSFLTNEGVEGGKKLEGVDGGVMKVVLSRDGGRSWGGFGAGGGEGERAVVATGRGGHWPGLLKLNDRRFLVLYSMDGVGAVSRVFELDG